MQREINSLLKGHNLPIEGCFSPTEELQMNLSVIDVFNHSKPPPPNSPSPDFIPTLSPASTSFNTSSNTINSSTSDSTPGSACADIFSLDDTSLRNLEQQRKHSSPIIDDFYFGAASSANYGYPNHLPNHNRPSTNSTTATSNFFPTTLLQASRNDDQRSTFVEYNHPPARMQEIVYTQQQQKEEREILMNLSSEQQEEEMHQEEHSTSINKSTEESSSYFKSEITKRTMPPPLRISTSPLQLAQQNFNRLNANQLYQQGICHSAPSPSSPPTPASAPPLLYRPNFQQMTQAYMNQHSTVYPMSANPYSANDSPLPSLSSLSPATPLSPNYYSPTYFPPHPHNHHQPHHFPPPQQDHQNKPATQTLRKSFSTLTKKNSIKKPAPVPTPITSLPMEIQTAQASTIKHLIKTTTTIIDSNGKKRTLHPAIYGCNYEGCGKVFTRPYNLRSHVKIHTGEKLFNCLYCDAKFTRGHDLKRHTRLHTNEKPFACGNCDKRFSRSDALKRHQKVDECYPFSKSEVVENELVFVDTDATDVGDGMLF